MSRIKLVISDCDGTLVTPKKTLTDAAIRAVQTLDSAGIGFTVTSSRPPFGMSMLVRPLNLRLALGPYNGSSLVDPDLKPIVQHVIPAAAVQRSLDVLADFKVDAWLFTNDQWIISRDDGKYVPHERDTIHFEPTFAADFKPWLNSACKIVGASADAEALKRCEIAMQAALGNTALAVRSQSYYLDITPPGQDKGTFVDAMVKRLGIANDEVATLGDMQNDLAMFKRSGLSIAMGNATDDVKAQAVLVTAANTEEGFAKGIASILERNGS